MLILLDIDGVMVQASSWKPVEMLDDGFSKFSIKAIKCLNKIISETNASIILTTSHKSSFNLSQWQEIFKKRGINVSIDKLEDNLNFLNRKDEILNWIKNNKDIEEFVIIDDDKSLNDLPKHIKDRVVLTSSMIGLTDEGASLAIEILNSSQLALA